MMLHPNQREWLASLARDPLAVVVTIAAVCFTGLIVIGTVKAIAWVVR